MEQENTNKTDAIKDYYKWCERAAIGALVIAAISAIAGMLVIIGLIVLLFFRNVSLLQVCLFILLALVMLGIAGTAVFLYIFHMRKQKEYVEYEKETEIFSFCEQTVGEIEKREDKDKMRIYVIKARMSCFRHQ